MNIFVTDKSFYKSAEALDDLRLNKMILETCQIFAYTMANNGCPTNELPVTKDGVSPYKVGGPHKKHPCTIWAGRTKGNYQWLFHHFLALNREREKRGFDYHACKRNAKCIRDGLKYIPDGQIEEFQNSSRYKSGFETIAAYRQTLADKWNEEKANPKKRDPKWTNTSQPIWYK